MKGSWIIVVGVAAALVSGCDDSTDGSGGAGSGSTTTTTSSTKASTGTMGTGSSTSTGMDPKAAACEAGCSAFAVEAMDLMCDPDTKAKCLTGCNNNYMNFPACEMEFIALYECIGMNLPSAMCMCDGMNNVTCDGQCGAESTAANDCATMMP